MPKSNRRLIAIMFTDIAGYTAMMGEDEARAVRALERSRVVVRENLEKFGGQLLDEIGDGSLSSFDSAVSAVECARAIQTLVGADPDYDLRIGIHIGDVLVTDDQVVGDGVNIASRIHGLASPGSICISDRVYDDLRNHPELAAEPLGEHELKNVNRRIMIYVLAAPGHVPSGESQNAKPGRPRRWAIAAVCLLVAGILLWTSGAAQRLAVLAAIELPRILSDDVEQEIGFVQSADGTRIAYATAGEGPAIVHVLGWASHVEKGLQSPAYNASVGHFAENFQFVQYDGRGSGLSDRNVKDFSMEARVADLEAVIDGLGFDRVVLWGMSAGGGPSLEYTLRHPEKVRRLILTATGASAASIRAANPMWNSIPDLVRKGWSRDDASARKIFTALISPNMDEVEQKFVHELFGVSMTGEDAGSFLEAVMLGDASDRLAEIKTPTLVIHARGDLLIPFEAGGRELAAGIPHARLVVLDTDNHAIPTGDPTYPEYIAAVDAFLNEDPELAPDNR
ncbi:MAG: alpha/beta fold hydrolase [Deltaproteobacteria bacterium]|nr:alpha/beta fold hydrolase [Deltaproteobacteria bacterium]MBW2386964.1 alpha/beta fold hydrolase [Deltaproteobacteria bacterium]